MASLWRVEDNRLKLAFHEGQERAWDSERRFVFVFAGTQGGKTSFGPWWLRREIQRCGPGDYLAVTSTFDLFKLKMLPELRSVFERLTRCGKYWAGDRLIELCDPEGNFWAKRSDDPMWGRIILRSAEAGGGLESATANAAWLDEAGMDSFTVETWEAVLRRLSLSQGRVLGTTTLYNLGFTKREIYDRWRAGDPDYHVIQFASVINPSFPPAEQERARRTMPLWRYLMVYEGQFAKPAGLIYDAFDEDLHVVEPFHIPPEWPCYAGVDFGGANTAKLFVAEKPGTMSYYLFSESLSGGKTTREHAREAWDTIADRRFVSAWGGSKSEKQSREDWTEDGFELKEPPISDVEGGINRVYQLFREHRLFVFSSCKGTLDELGTYRRKLDDNGDATEEIENKRTFHRLDALRYLASGLLGPDDAFLGMPVMAGWSGWNPGK